MLMTLKTDESMIKKCISFQYESSFKSVENDYQL